MPEGPLGGEARRQGKFPADLVKELLRQFRFAGAFGNRRFGNVLGPSSGGRFDKSVQLVAARLRVGIEAWVEVQQVSTPFLQSVLLGFVAMFALAIEGFRDHKGQDGPIKATEAPPRGVADQELAPPQSKRRIPMPGATKVSDLALF